MRTAAGRRRLTLLRGLGAERLALAWLILKGYRPLARRFAAAGGEIDLVMRRGRTTVFVEVKARARLAEAAEAIGPTKQRRFRRAARAWQSAHPAGPDALYRADAVFIAPDAFPRHQIDAFPLDEL